MPYPAQYAESVFSLEILEPSPVEDTPYEEKTGYFPEDAAPEDPPPKLLPRATTLGLSGHGPVYYCTSISTSSACILLTSSPIRLCLHLRQFSIPSSLYPRAKTFPLVSLDVIIHGRTLTSGSYSYPTSDLVRGDLVPHNNFLSLSVSSL